MTELLQQLTHTLMWNEQIFSVMLYFRDIELIQRISHHSSDLNTCVHTVETDSDSVNKLRSLSRLTVKRKSWEMMIISDWSLNQSLSSDD